MKRLILIMAACLPVMGLLAAEVEPISADTIITLEKKRIEVKDNGDRMKVRVYELDENGEAVDDEMVFEGHYRDGQSYERRFSCLRRFRAGLASRLYRGRRAEPDLSASYHQADRRSYGYGFGASADKTIRRRFSGFVNAASPNYPTYRHKNAARFFKPRRILLLFLN